MRKDGGDDYRRGKRPTSHERTNVDDGFVDKMKSELSKSMICSNFWSEGDGPSRRKPETALHLSMPDFQKFPSRDSSVGRAID